MSWCNGIQQTWVEAREWPMAHQIISRFSRRLAWRTMTPFGADVDPEVY